MPFYAVANGRNIGIFLTWDECNESIKGFKQARYKKFKTREEAENFIQSKDIVETKPTSITSFFEQKREPSTEISHEFIPDYYVYTDGACINNGSESAMAGMGIYFGPDDPRNVSQRIDGKQSNNTAELTAIIKTFSIIENDILAGKNITIMSDSDYSIRCCTTYGEKCSQKNWNVDIPNKELVRTAFELYKNIKNVRFVHIKAHTNASDIHSIGNDNADRLANLSIGIENCPYNNCIYLNVPFCDKDQIKQLGGLWDATKKNGSYIKTIKINPTF